MTSVPSSPPRRSIHAPLVAVALLCLVVRPSHATTLSDDFAKIRFEALSARADAAAHVRVLAQSFRLAGDPGSLHGGRIVTDSECEVVDAAFGAAPGDHVTITTLGGYLALPDGRIIGQRVFGLAQFDPGDELAVLLGHTGYMGGGHTVVGASYGVFQVMAQPSALNNDKIIVGALHAAPSNAPIRQAALDAPTTVGEFLSRARASRP